MRRAASIEMDFGPRPPAPSITCCGACVHRNGAPEVEIAACAPQGLRHKAAPPCPWAFGRAELNGAVYGHSGGVTWPALINGRS